MGWVQEEVWSSGLLDYLAVLHDGDAVCDLGDYGEVVGDEEHGQIVGGA